MTLSTIVLPKTPAIEAPAVGADRSVEVVLVDHHLADSGETVLAVEATDVVPILFPFFRHDGKARVVWGVEGGRRSR